MATTSVWRVNGWLGKVLIYIENPDKTENPDFFEKQDMGGKEAQGLADVIEYAVQRHKTSQSVESEGETVLRQFVSGVNCSPSTARDEMIAVKSGLERRTGLWPTTAIRALPPARSRRSWPMRSAFPWQKAVG